MKKKEEVTMNFNSTPMNPLKILDSQEITDPLLLPVFFHEQKRKMLDLLREKEYTLKDLSDNLKLNPGSIKRFLDELMKFKLIVVARTEVSSYSIVMKYYRAVAKKFIINIKMEI